MASPSSQEYSVNWKNHMSHVRKAFDNLLSSNELTDVTLHCEGKKIGAHKMLLSACSGYFRDTFKDVSCQNPIIFMYGVEFGVLSDILRFIYNGEVSVDTSKLDRFLKTAQALQISGLADCEAEKIAAVSESIAQSTPVERNVEDQVHESSTLAATSGGDEARKGIKRSKDRETETTNKVMRQENDQVFLPEVKSEPCEMVNFEDLLEDPLMQADQSNDSKDFFGAPGQSLEDEEFKHVNLRNKLISMKKRNYSSYKQAKNVLKDLEGKLGTDTEEGIQPTRENKRLPEINPPVSSICNFNNQLPPQIQAQENNEEYRPPRISDTTKKEFQQNLKQRSVIILQNDVVVPSKKTSHAEMDKDHEDASTRNGSFEETVLQNQEMMINEIINLNASFDSLMGFIGKIIKPPTPSTVAEKPDEFVSLEPINSKERLTELEEELKDENYMQRIVDSMAFVCGRSGTENGLNACYKLVDYFLDRNFVDECSWTGNSKSGGQTPKIALKFYTNFRKCFLNTVRLANKEFSEVECDDFFKRILKNSSQRKNAKRILSTSKNRPKNLRYNSRKQSVQTFEEPSNSYAQAEEMKNEIEEFSEGEIANQGDNEYDN